MPVCHCFAQRLAAAESRLVGGSDLWRTDGIAGWSLAPRQHVAEGVEPRPERLQGRPHAGEPRHEAAQVRRHLPDRLTARQLGSVAWNACLPCSRTAIAQHGNSTFAHEEVKSRQT